MNFRLWLRENWRLVAALLFVAAVGLTVLGLAAFYPPTIAFVFTIAGISMAAHSVAAQIFITAGIAAAAASVFALAANAVTSLINGVTRKVQPDSSEYIGTEMKATQASREQHALNEFYRNNFAVNENPTYYPPVFNSGRRAVNVNSQTEYENENSRTSAPQ